MAKSFSFIHAADLHLDTPFTGMGQLPQKLRERVVQSTFTAYDHLIQLCIDRNVDFLLLAGDIYDTSTRSLRAQLYFKKGLDKLAEQGIRAYIVHGNHDPVNGREFELTLPANTFVFPPGEVVSRSFVKDGKELARIYGASYPQSHVRESYLPGFQREDGDFFAIGLLHTNVDGNPDHDNYAPVSRADLIQQGFDYWALGHIHQKSILHDDPVILYPGNIQGRNLKETGERGCYYVKVAEKRVTELTFCATDALRWYQEQVDLSGCEQIQDILDRLEDKKEQVRIAAEGRGAFVRFLLTGRTVLHSYVYEEKNRADMLEILRGLEEEREDFVWIDGIEVKTKPLLQWEQVAEEETLLGDFYQLARSYYDLENLQKLRNNVLSPLFDHYLLRGCFRDLSGEEILEWLKEAEVLGFDLLVPGEDEK